MAGTAVVPVDNLVALRERVTDEIPLVVQQTESAGQDQRLTAAMNVVLERGSVVCDRRHESSLLGWYRLPKFIPDAVPTLTA